MTALKDMPAPELVKAIAHAIYEGQMIEPNWDRESGFIQARCIDGAMGVIQLLLRDGLLE